MVTHLCGIIFLQKVCHLDLKELEYLSLFFHFPLVHQPNSQLINDLYLPGKEKGRWVTRVTITRGLLLRNPSPDKWFLQKSQRDIVLSI